MAVSDTHGRHRQLNCPEGDVLIHAGDLTTRGTLDELEDVAEWFGELSYSRIIVVAGNHDFCLADEQRREEAEQLLSDVTYLRNQSTEMNGRLIWGSPYTPTYGQWAFQKDRGDEIDEVWCQIPEEVDVLVTHGPPRGFGDRIRAGRRVGCKRLADRVDECSPDVHLFGHIHEAGGRWEQGGTTLLNVSSTTFGYESIRQPLKLDC